MNMKRQLYILCIFLTLLFLFSCRDSSDNLITVEDNTITPIYSDKSEQITSDTNNILPEEPSESNLNEKSVQNSVMLTDGTKNVIPVTVYVGDTFLDWTITEIEASYSGDYLDSLKMDFKGQKTVKGALGYSKDNPYHPLYFFVDESSYDLFPYAIGDTRDIWFTFSNYDEVINMLDDKEVSYKNCEIIIEDYYIYFAPTEVANSSKLLSIISLGD